MDRAFFLLYLTTRNTTMNTPLLTTIADLYKIILVPIALLLALFGGSLGIMLALIILFPPYPIAVVLAIALLLAIFGSGGGILFALIILFILACFMFGRLSYTTDLTPSKQTKTRQITSAANTPAKTCHTELSDTDRDKRDAIFEIAGIVFLCAVLAVLVSL